MSGIHDARVVEYVGHLHEHFVEPVRVERARYHLPAAPGYAEIMPASLREYSYPDGAAWAVRDPA